MVLTLFLVWPVPAGCDTYFMFSSFGATWHDADKDWQGDSNMCWAAVAANILTWGGWQVPQFHNGELILENFATHRANEGGHVSYAPRRWSDGPDPGEGRIDIPGGGNYWRNFFPCSRPYNPEMDPLQQLEQDLDGGFASVPWGRRRLSFIGAANHVVCEFICQTGDFYRILPQPPVILIGRVIIRISSPSENYAALMPMSIGTPVMAFWRGEK